MIPQHELKQAEKEVKKEKLIIDALTMYANTNSVDEGLLAQTALEVIRG